MTVESPCVGQCRADSSKARCVGCGRTLAEIGRWSRMTDAEKREVIERTEREDSMSEPTHASDGRGGRVMSTTDNTEVIRMQPGDYIAKTDIPNAATLDAIIDAHGRKGCADSRCYAWLHDINNRYLVRGPNALLWEDTPGNGRRLTPADLDVWIDWHGGPCPVPKGTLVDVEHRDGIVFYAVPAGESQAYDWSCDCGGGTIVRYRLHQPVQQPTQQPENETDRRIAALEREIEALKKARRDEQAPPQPVEKWEPQRGDYWISAAGNVRTARGGFDFAAFGTERPTRELAEAARDAMRVHNRALAYVHEHAPDWDGSYPFAVERMSMEMVIDSPWEIRPCPYQRIGVVRGPKHVMQQLADDLNSGLVDLDGGAS